MDNGGGGIKRAIVGKNSHRFRRSAGERHFYIWRSANAVSGSFHLLECSQLSLRYTGGLQRISVYVIRRVHVVIFYIYIIIIIIIIISIA